MPKRIRKYKMSDKAKAQRRSAAVKHGRHAVIGARQALLNKIGTDLAEIHPDAPKIVKAYQAVFDGGGLEARLPLAIDALVANEIILRKGIEEVHKLGVVVEDVREVGGVVIEKKWKANPAVAIVGEFSDRLGYTGRDMMLTPKSQGEGAKNLAAAALMAREAKLLAAGRDGGMPRADIKLLAIETNEPAK